jgi:vacuolar-type H+-ATPase subunit I/STV1
MFSNIPRYSQGFGGFGPLELCKDGKLVKVKDVDQAILEWAAELEEEDTTRKATRVSLLEQLDRKEAEIDRLQGHILEMQERYAQDIEILNADLETRSKIAQTYKYQMDKFKKSNFCWAVSALVTTALWLITMALHIKEIQ